MPNWSQVLQEIQAEANNPDLHGVHPIDRVRRAYLASLSSYTGRNVIAYYSGFLSKDGVQGVEINDEDKNGLMLAVNGLDRKLGLDLILHTPGGSIAVTETIVDYIKRMFGRNVRAIVPQIAMSAGTMIACSCKIIVMGKQSSLGPVDPQLNGVPTAGVIEEFKKAYEEISIDPNKVSVWQFIIRQYTPSFLGQCQNAVDWASNFVKAELENNMLRRYKEKSRIADNIVKSLTDFSGTKAHDRHIHYDECRKMGLRVALMEDDQTLQDRILTVHHCYMHTMMSTPVFKLIENQNGEAFVKSQAVASPMPFPMVFQYPNAVL